jgi:acyl carrier protein
MDNELRDRIEQRRELLSAIKAELVERLDLEIQPEWIDDDVFLFGGGLGLDSIDAMEIIIGMQTRFELAVPEDSLSILRTVNTLADFVQERRVQETQPVAA